MRDDELQAKTADASMLQHALTNERDWPTLESNGWSLDVIIGKGLRAMLDPDATLVPGRTRLGEVVKMAEWLGRFGYQMRRISERVDAFLVEPGLVNQVGEFLVRVDHEATRPDGSTVLLPAGSRLRAAGEPGSGSTTRKDPRTDWTCDECGKEGTGNYVVTGWFAPPPGWFTSETDEEGSVSVCSRECAQAYDAKHRWAYGKVTQ